MDPTACWQRLLDAVAEGDIDEAKQALSDLNHWLTLEGFPPEQWVCAPDGAALFDASKDDGEPDAKVPTLGDAYKAGRAWAIERLKDDSITTKPECTGCTICERRWSWNEAPCGERHPESKAWCERPRNHTECGAPCRWTGEEGPVTWKALRAADE